MDYEKRLWHELNDAGCVLTGRIARAETQEESDRLLKAKDRVNKLKARYAKRITNRPIAAA
jgi:hypothetical protein